MASVNQLFSESFPVKYIRVSFVFSGGLMMSAVLPFGITTTVADVIRDACLFCKRRLQRNLSADHHDLVLIDGLQERVPLGFTPIPRDAVLSLIPKVAALLRAGTDIDVRLVRAPGSPPAAAISPDQGRSSIEFAPAASNSIPRYRDLAGGNSSSSSRQQRVSPIRYDVDPRTASATGEGRAQAHVDEVAELRERVARLQEQLEMAVASPGGYSAAASPEHLSPQQVVPTTDSYSPSRRVVDDVGGVWPPLHPPSGPASPATVTRRRDVWARDVPSHAGSLATTAIEAPTNAVAVNTVVDDGGRELSFRGSHQVVSAETTTTAVGTRLYHIGEIIVGGSGESGLETTSRISSETDSNAGDAAPSPVPAPLSRPGSAVSPPTGRVMRLGDVFASLPPDACGEAEQAPAALSMKRADAVLVHPLLDPLGTDVSREFLSRML